jgi:type I restriction enzyme M protein
MNDVFRSWATDTSRHLKELDQGCKPKDVIFQIAEDLLRTYEGKPLLNKYDIYQHLMNYWSDTMQDDLYQISEEGWIAEPYRILERNKKTGKETDKGWTCDLVPPSLLMDYYFVEDKEAISALEGEKESIAAQISELEEEHGGEEGYFADFEKINKATVSKRLKELTGAVDAKEEIKVLKTYLQLSEQQSQLGTESKKQADTLDRKTWDQYKKLTSEDIKQLVVEQKWMRALETAIQGEMERISQRLTGRIKELIERYDSPLPSIDKEITLLEEKVSAHLHKMGFVWK